MIPFNIAIPYKSIEESRWEQLLATMVAGNTLLKKWSLTLLGNRKEREFRKLLFKGEFKDQIPQDELKAILSVKDIQDEVFCGFNRLAIKIANKWCSRKSNIEDCCQEAFVSLVDAIYGYTDSKVKFITYAWVTIQNTMKTYETKESSLMRVSKSHRSLVSEFNKTKKDANRHMTFDEAVIRMDLAPVEIKILGEALVKVIRESDGGLADGDTDAGLLDNVVGQSVSVEHNCEVAEVMDAIDNAGLTALERSALEASMHSSHGWKKAFADQNTNPKTGRPYTRAAVKIILDRAHQKIKKYLKVA